MAFTRCFLAQGRLCAVLCHGSQFSCSQALYIRPLHVCRQSPVANIHQGVWSSEPHNQILLKLSKRGNCLHQTPLGYVRQVCEVQHVPARHFQTSSRRCIPPIFWVLIKPVAKLGAILSGRSVRKWWRALPEKRRRYFWGRIKQNWYWFVLGGLGIGVGSLVYYTTHLEETPFTGRRRFIVVTHEQFEKIAAAEALQLMQKFQDKILPNNHPMVKRVVDIAQRLLDANPETENLMRFPTWKVCIIDDPTTVNACVLPTGHIFIFSGIIKFADNEDQFAMILAHEMAHALLSHGIETVSYTQLVDFVIIATMAALWCIIPGDGLAIITQWFYDRFIDILLHMPYSRKLEKEADKVGMELAARACYDVREGVVFWNRMHVKDAILQPDQSIPEWLSTHPSNKTRIEFLDFLVPKALEIRSQEGKCPDLPTKDPRAVIEEISALADDFLKAKKAGQNLARVQRVV